MNSCNCPTETVPATAQADPVYRPRFRTTEDEKGACVRIALPGVCKEDLKLTLLESNLRIEASRSDLVPDGWKTHHAASPVRRYGLELRLPLRLDGNQTIASFESGVLTLQVPVREETKPRQIAVC